LVPFGKISIPAFGEKGRLAGPVISEFVRKSISRPIRNFESISESALLTRISHIFEHIGAPESAKVVVVQRL
jgi:hypothetical protein